MHDSSVKWAIVVGMTIFACLSVIVGGIVYSVKLDADNERECIKSNRVWVRYTCLEEADDVRYIND
jgi:hypothetical protein